jgi:hypothetical protein
MQLCDWTFNFGHERSEMEWPVSTRIWGIETPNLSEELLKSCQSSAQVIYYMPDDTWNSPLEISAQIVHICYKNANKLRPGRIEV